MSAAENSMCPDASVTAGVSFPADTLRLIVDTSTRSRAATCRVVSRSCAIAPTIVQKHTCMLVPSLHNVLHPPQPVHYTVHMADTTTAAPELESVRWATTTTTTEQRVRILVTSVESESVAGWVVWGYRQYNRATRNGRPRQSMYPQSYFIAR